MTTIAYPKSAGELITAEDMNAILEKIQQATDYIGTKYLNVSPSGTQVGVSITNTGTGKDIDGSKFYVTKGGDVVSLDATKGLVLKDTQGTPHYWRLQVTTTGLLTTTDLGTTAPTA